MKIAAGICVYSDVKGLDRLLSSIIGNVDKCIIVHGPYTNYKGIDPYSSAATKAVCRRYSSNNNNNNILMMIDNKSPTDEIISRQMYLDQAQDCDFLLVLDADEYVIGDWHLFRENCQKKIIDSPKAEDLFYLYDIKFDKPPPQWSDGFPRPRLFYKPSQIKYYRKHYWWLLPTGKVIKTSESDSHQLIEGIKITMDNTTCRSNERNEIRQQYVNWLGRKEELMPDL